MRQLDTLFQHKMSANGKQNESDVEERLFNYQKRLEIMMKTDMEHQV